MKSNAQVIQNSISIIPFPSGYKEIPKHPQVRNATLVDPAQVEERRVNIKTLK